MWLLWSKSYFIRNSIWIFFKWGLKVGISIDADSGPLRYLLWSCSSICYQPFTFIQVISGHTVDLPLNMRLRYLYLLKKNLLYQTVPLNQNIFLKICTAWKVKFAIRKNKKGIRKKNLTISKSCAEILTEYEKLSSSSSSTNKSGFWLHLSH